MSITHNNGNGLMLQNVDIIFGIICWLFALFIHQQSFYSFKPFFWEFAHFYVYPILWFALLIIAMHLRRRSMIKLWWVWLSDPVSLFWPAIKVIA